MEGRLDSVYHNYLLRLYVFRHVIVALPVRTNPAMGTLTALIIHYSGLELIYRERLL